MAVLTYRPGDLDNTNFRGINRVQPTGIEVEAGLYGAVANEFEKVSQTYTKIQERKDELAKREAEAQIKIAEKDLENVDPAAPAATTPTQQANAAALQVADAATQGYTAKLELDLQGNLARIANETAGQPDRMRDRMDAYINETTTKMPSQLGAYYRENATREANTHLQKSATDRLNADVADAKNSVVTLVNSQQDQLQGMPAPDSVVAQSALELRSAKLQVALDNAVRAGYMTQGEAQLRVMEVQDSMMQSAIVGEIQRAPNKLQFALNIAAGKSGTYLDQASPKQRMQALAAAQQIANVEDQIQSRKDREVTRAKEAAFVRYQKDIIADPYADHSATLGRMLNSANTVADMERYEKMKNFIDNSEDDLYNKSNRKTMLLFDMRANQGTLQQADLDEAFGNMDENKRIGADDYRRLTAKLEGDREGMVNTLAYKTFASRLATEFPAPKKGFLDGIAAAIGRNNMPMGASMPAETTTALSENEKLQNETLLELQEAIRDGVVTSPAQLTNWGNERLNAIRTQRKQGIYQPEIQRPAVKMAMDVVAADPALRSLYEGYKTDRLRFINDVKSGKLNTYQANVINRALKGEALQPVNQTPRERR